MASGDLYDRGMGKLGPGGVGGGSVKFNPDGSTHTTVRGYDYPAGRISWDADALGRGNPHFSDQGFPKGDPLRHPFGR